LRALLNSITSEVGQHPDAVKRLSEKLGELVGEDAVKGFDPARNERGEVCLRYSSTPLVIKSVILSS